MALSDDVPLGTISRLTEHYGQDVADWLLTAPRIIGEASEAWGVHLLGFYDAGWTSVIGVGTRGDEWVVLKATPDRDRFPRERAALLHWRGVAACPLLDTDDARQVLLLRAVGNAAGGTQRPTDHEARVASAVRQLHGSPAPPSHVLPTLAEHHHGEVIPRIERRARSLEHPLSYADIEAVITLCGKLCSGRASLAVLHADLYAENVLFGGASDVVFIDPLPMVGDPAFDWAFWAIYYTPPEGFERRLALCELHAPDLVERVVKWAATLAADGALFYIETQDERVTEMIRILSTDPIQHALAAA